MNKKRVFRVNEPHVVYETIDGETIIMDLRTGSYYSIEWPGVVIWEYLASGGNLENILIEDQRLEAHQNSMHHFLNILVQESLIKEEIVQNTDDVAVLSDEQKAEIKKLADSFKAPLISKYTDMQEMLLLDPIHDVDEKGWPEPKKEDE